MDEERTSEGLNAWVSRMLESDEPLYIERSRKDQLGDQEFFKQAFQRTGKEKLLVMDDDGNLVRVGPGWTKAELEEK